MEKSNAGYCTASGKKMFLSKGDANELLLKAKNPPRINGRRVKRRMNKRNEVRVYFCNECDHWHLTSKEHYKTKKRNEKSKN